MKMSNSFLKGTGRGGVQTENLGLWTAVQGGLLAALNGALLFLRSFDLRNASCFTCTFALIESTHLLFFEIIMLLKDGFRLRRP